MMNIRPLQFLVCFLFLYVTSKAQVADTLRLTNQQAEALFLKNNLSLLAAQYNIDATTALIRQAKLWDNPLLATDQNLYDGKFFSHSKSSGTPHGEVNLQLQQLIRTAGKISKQVNIARTNAKISELQYQVLVRNLRYTIHNDLYQVNQLTTIAQAYEQELQQINVLYAGMKAQLQAGNISQKDFLRIQALQITLLQEQADYKRQLIDVQNELHTVLQLKENAFVLPQLDAVTFTPLSISMDSALVLAEQNNPDYLLDRSGLVLQQQNLNYQKALRVPDVTLGGEYDRRNSYVPNYYGLMVALPLPLFNHNQGNIASASFSVRQQQTIVDQHLQSLSNNLQAAFSKLRLNQQLQQAIDPDFKNKYTQLIQNAIKAYQLRQLGLLEFIDLFDTYKATQLKYLEQQFNLQKSKEDLNLLLGKDVI